MKLSKRDTNDLIKVIETVRTMAQWGEGGSFITLNGELDPKARDSALRGVDIIKTMIMQRD